MASNTRNTRGDRPTGKPNRRKAPNWLFWFYILLFVGLGYMFLTSSGVEPIKKEWIEVKEEILPSGDIDKVVYIRNEHRGEIYISKDSISQYKNIFGGRNLSPVPISTSSFLINLMLK